MIRSILPLLAVLVLGAVAEVAHTQESRFYLCGRDLASATAEPQPPGLDTGGCSDATGFGEDIFAPSSSGGPTGPIDLSPVVVLKPLDANSLRLRRDLIEQRSVEGVALHALRTGPGGLEQFLRLEIVGARITSLNTGYSAGAPTETLTISGQRYQWSIWVPSGSPGSAPTETYCWDVDLAQSC